MISGCQNEKSDRWVRSSGMSVLCGSHVPDPVMETARATAMSSDAQWIGGELIAFRTASRITQVPSGAQ